jgi:acyl carrier protein
MSVFADASDEAPSEERNDVIDVLRTEIRKVKDTLPPDVDTTALLMTDLGLDSLDVVEFVARVEEVYRVSVPDEDWQQLSTLDRIAAYVTAHR